MNVSAYLIQLPSLSRSWKNSCRVCELLSLALRAAARSFSLHRDKGEGGEREREKWE